MTGGTFEQIGGFWQPQPFATTAASVVVSGRVQTAAGRAVSDAIVTATDMFGNRRSTRTNAFGFFRMAGIPSGESHLIQVTARRYTFDATLITVTDDITGLTVTARP